MTTSGTTNDNEWQREVQRMATNDNEWQHVTTSDTTSDKEWQRMTTSGTTDENEWKRMWASKREWFWFQNEPKYAMCLTTIYSAIEIICKLRNWRSIFSI